MNWINRHGNVTRGQKLLAGFCLCLALAGCETSRNNEVGIVDKVQKGMTRAEVVALMGRPRGTVEHDGPGGKTESLSYLWHRKGQAFDTMMGAKDPRSQVVTIVIGPDGKVESITKAANPD